MRDADIRPSLASVISSKMASQQHLFVPEVDIRWSIPARADALLVERRISGFEIKSDRDSLSRLPRQVAAYNEVVERAYLVVGERHRERATALVPDWWHIWLAVPHADTVRIRQVRRGHLNPSVSPLAVTSFLTRSQLVTELSHLGKRNLSSTSADALRLMLAGHLSPAATMRVARRSMLERSDWRQKSLTAL